MRRGKEGEAMQCVEEGAGSEVVYGGPLKVAGHALELFLGEVEA